MTKSLRSDPRRIRAARRAKLPVVRSRRPSPGRHHPASAADIREALRRFGEGAYYGVVAIELMPAPVTSKHIPLGELIGPGQIVLYDQPLPPWRLGFDLPANERSRLRAAGAVTDREGIVAWPGSTLRRFMLAYVLAHELGHHMLQHERRLRGEAAARTRDHDARAEAIARRLRARLD